MLDMDGPDWDDTMSAGDDPAGDLLVEMEKEDIIDEIHFDEWQRYSRQKATEHHETGKDEKRVFDYFFDLMESLVVIAFSIVCVLMCA